MLQFALEYCKMHNKFNSGQLVPQSKSEACPKYAPRIGIPDFGYEKAGRSSLSLKSYHGERRGSLEDVYLLVLLATGGKMTPKLTTTNAEIYAKLVAGIENGNHDNHEIMTENTQERAKIFNHEKM
jgi:hypothetical protein